MTDYDSIRNHCERNSRISEKVLDNFIISYGIEKDRLDKEMEKRFRPFRQVFRKTDNNLLDLLKTQYLAHKIFKKDGLINKYLQHSAIKNLSSDKRAFLEANAKNSWKFSFSIITDNPHEDFYIMKDIFRDVSFLVYSNAVSRILHETEPLIWFNLVAPNGLCWQTYGPVIYFNGFIPDDIFFFATEVNQDIETFEDLIDVVESNPVPFMMLVNGSTLPLTYNNEHLLVQTVSTYDVDLMDTSIFQSDFASEYNKGVYRFTMNKWGEHPHFSTVYFDENESLIQLSAATDKGYEVLSKKMNELGFQVSPEPDIRVTLLMLATAGRIFRKSISADEYSHLFMKETSPEDQKELDKINTFFGLLINELNSGIEPDIEKHAKAAGIDLETARSAYAAIMAKFDSMRGKR